MKLSYPCWKIERDPILFKLHRWKWTHFWKPSSNIWLERNESGQRETACMHVYYGYQNSPARCHQLWIIDQNISFTQPYREVCVVQHDSCESNHIKSIYSMADLIFEKSDKLAKEIVERKNITFLYWPFHGHRVSSMLEWRLHQWWFMRSLFSFSLVSLWKNVSSRLPFTHSFHTLAFPFLLTFFLFRFYSTQVLRVGLDFKRKKKGKGNRRTTELY